MDISWFVVSVVVDPVDGHALRTWTDVCVERREIVDPFLAHSDAPSAVPLVVVIVRIQTTLLGRIPHSVFLRPSHSVSRPSLTNCVA